MGDREQGHLEVEGDEDDWKQDIQLSKKDLDLLRRRQRQDVIASKVAGYVWDQEVKNIFKFPDLQKASPPRKERGAYYWTPKPYIDMPLPWSQRDGGGGYTPL